MPALAVLQRLLNTGWSLAEAEPLVHTAESPRELSSVACGPTRKHCWRCLLRLGHLLDSGLTGLHSGQRWEYYYLLLHSNDPVSVPVNLSAKQYTALMKKGSDTAIDDAESDSSSSAPVMESIGATPVRGLAIGPKRRRVSSGDTEDLRSLLGIAGIGPSEPMEMEATEAEASAVAPPASAALHTELPPPPSEHGMEFTVQGIVFTVSKWPLVATSFGPAQYTRYIVRCPLSGNDPLHKGCKKYRNAGPNQCKLGAWEPIAYLCQWVNEAKQCQTRQEHIAHVPKQRTVRQFMIANNWCLARE